MPQKIILVAAVSILGALLCFSPTMAQQQTESKSNVKSGFFSQDTKIENILEDTAVTISKKKSQSTGVIDDTFSIDKTAIVRANRAGRRRARAQLRRLGNPLGRIKKAKKIYKKRAEKKAEKSIADIEKPLNTLSTGDKDLDEAVQTANKAAEAFNHAHDSINGKPNAATIEKAINAADKIIKQEVKEEKKAKTQNEYTF